MLNGSYHGYLDNVAFHPSTFINGGVSMATSLLVMLITGTAHPPYVLCVFLFLFFLYVEFTFMGSEKKVD